LDPERGQALDDSTIALELLVVLPALDTSSWLRFFLESIMRAMISPKDNRLILTRIFDEKSARRAKPPLWRRKLFGAGLCQSCGTD
jgi:hypothetical protein